MLVAVIAVYAIGVAIEPAMQVYRMSTAWSESRLLDLAGVRGIRLGPQEYGYSHPIATFFREHTNEDERIYAGLLRHDAIVINKPIFYAVAQRRSCCRYSELHPGVADRIEAQQEIIRDMERHDVRVLIIWKCGWSNTVLDEFKARSRAAIYDGSPAHS